MKADDLLAISIRIMKRGSMIDSEWRVLTRYRGGEEKKKRERERERERRTFPRSRCKIHVPSHSRVKNGSAVKPGVIIYKESGSPFSVHPLTDVHASGMK